MGSLSTRTPPWAEEPLLWNVWQALEGWGCQHIQVATLVAATWPVPGANVDRGRVAAGIRRRALGGAFQRQACASRGPFHLERSSVDGTRRVVAVPAHADCSSRGQAPMQCLDDQCPSGPGMCFGLLGQGRPWSLPLMSPLVARVSAGRRWRASSFWHGGSRHTATLEAGRGSVGTRPYPRGSGGLLSRREEAGRPWPRGHLGLRALRLSCCRARACARTGGDRAGRPSVHVRTHMYAARSRAPPQTGEWR